MFWVVTPNSCEGGYQRIAFNTEDGSDLLFRNVGNHLRMQKVLQFRIDINTSVRTSEHIRVVKSP